MNHTEEAIKSAKPSENFTGWNLDEHAERNGWAGVGLVTGVNGLAEAVANIQKQLDEYPILDEDLWSQYEWDENHPEDDNRCWDEDECSCGLPKA